jgi:hypothetical protein
MYVNNSHPYLTIIIVIIEVAVRKFNQGVGIIATRLSINAVSG